MCVSGVCRQNEQHAFVGPREMVNHRTIYWLFTTLYCTLFSYVFDDLEHILIGNRSVRASTICSVTNGRFIAELHFEG